MFRRLLATLALTVSAAPAADTLLNVSYDVTREFYTDFNRAFIANAAEHNNRVARIDMSHGGSSKQARAILDGLEADVATMNQDTDIQVLARNGLVPENWKSLLPNNSVPYQSTIVFLVRKGNPKGIRDWADLAQPGVSVIIPNPKTSGNGRYSYLAAWAWAEKQFPGDEPAVRDFVARLFKNVPVLESGGRSATNTFVQKGIGDVLLTFESETLQISRVFDPKNYEVVYPSLSIAAEAPVAVVEKNTRRRGTTSLARQYLLFLWSSEGQRLAARHFLRPKDPEIAAEFASNFPAIPLARIDNVFGGWDQAQKTHFEDGGLFDQIYTKK